MIYSILAFCIRKLNDTPEDAKPTKKITISNKTISKLKYRRIKIYSCTKSHKRGNESYVFLFISDNERTEITKVLKMIEETSHFTLATNNIQYLGVTLSTQVKDLYNKKFKSLKNRN